MAGRLVSGVLRTGVALGLAGTLLAGCSAPEFSYVASGDSTSFIRVPSGWTQFREAVFEAAAFGDDTEGQQLAQSAWTVGFDASASPAVEHVMSISASAPAVYFQVRELNGSTAITDDMMRDLLLPVTEQARLTAASQGRLLTGFQLVSDQSLDPGDGVHGVHTTFTYLIGSTVQTFDQKVLVNGDDTKLYTLLAHCSAQCFTTHADDLDDLVGSLTVRS
ncbi:MAG: hypothetical protein AAGC63_00365 [Propionicimonas sp.]|nr:hypothetical protein [Propionicimonas sp.]